MCLHFVCLLICQFPLNVSHVLEYVLVVLSILQRVSHVLEVKDAKHAVEGRHACWRQRTQACTEMFGGMLLHGVDPVLVVVLLLHHMSRDSILCVI